MILRNVVEKVTVERQSTNVMTTCVCKQFKQDLLAALEEDTTSLTNFNNCVLLYIFIPRTISKIVSTLLHVLNLSKRIFFYMKLIIKTFKMLIL